MEKRQGIMVAAAGLFILAGAGLWWFMQDSAEAPAQATAVAPPAVKHATVSAPLPAATSAPAPVIATAPRAGSESDAVALSEEAVDKALAEKNELASRADELNAQVNDGKALIALKEKQIRELEARLKAAKAPAKK